MNIEKTLELNGHEIELVTGAVAEGPDGQGCTERHDPAAPKRSTEQGGPAFVDFSRFF